MKAKKMKKYEEIGGNHYGLLKYEPVDFIMKFNLNWFQGEILKYVSRFLNKNGKQDLRKARSVCDIAMKLEDTQLKILFPELTDYDAIHEYASQFPYSEIMEKILPEILRKNYKEAKSRISSLLWRYYATSN